VRLLLLLLAACAATPRADTPRADTPRADTPRADTPRAVDESRFGPLEVGADYRSYRKLTPEPFLSRVHGNRWVEVWVSEAGADAYLDGGAIPVGTVVVKASWSNEGGRPGAPGPIFVMRKEAPGYAPEHEDWYHAIHWAEPDEGAPLYWRGRSPKVAYCYDCHDSYDRGLGGLTPSSLLLR
jgi:hypothetical protein